MYRIAFMVLWGSAATGIAADKVVKPAQSGNQLVEISGTVVNDKAGVAAALGMSADVDLVVVEIKIVPKGDNKLAVNHDDFTLISRKDGQRSAPLSPSQIAGKGALMVTSTGPSGGSGMQTGNRGPIWGGMPGTGGRPRRMGGDGEATGEGSPAQADAKVITADKENPLLTVLKAKLLKEGETLDPVTGQLYFLLEGKHKPKDLDLLYRTAEGRLELDFIK